MFSLLHYHHLKNPESRHLRLAENGNVIVTLDNFPDVVSFIRTLFYKDNFIVTVCGLWQLKLYLCVSVCTCLSVCVCLSRFYLVYYGPDFDQTWLKCWNFGSIDCLKNS